VYFQQGDVLLKRIEQLPDGVVPLSDKSRILQRGETTGHKHAFAADAKVQLYTVPASGPLSGLRISTHDGVAFVEILEPTTLRHEEHNPIEVEPGIYEVDLVREFDYESLETRRVAD
jgi:hypothetical protein